MEVAHGILANEISKSGSQALLVLYPDGDPAVEKALTTVARKERCKTSLESAKTQLREFEQRINLRVRKWYFLDVIKNLKGAFYWTAEARRSFAQYMRERQWNVVESPTEADIGTALDSRPADVAIASLTF
ncbi:hypothetical protein BGZ58_001576 [Dissophora ornata]|nr:hypothetical protein BGZ58_001576 [Dissophora ornata]